MAVIVKVIRHSDGGSAYLRNMCWYVRDERKLAYGGYGVNISDFQTAYEQMECLRRYYSQVSTNPLVHIIISFDEETDNIQFAVANAHKIASYFMKEYIYLWCIHKKDEECSHIHMHLLLNSVNLKNGKLFHSGIYEMNEFCYHIQKITHMEWKLVFAKSNNRQDHI